jgi:chromosome segregation ATPase
MLTTILQYIGKMDAKTIIIIVLLTILGGFYIKGMFTPDEHASEIAKLEKANKEIVKQKEDLEGTFKVTKELFERDSTNVVKLKKELKLLESILAKKEEDLRLSKEALRKAKLETEKIRAKIKDIEENPIKRTGDDLLESIKQKTK